MGTPYQGGSRVYFGRILVNNSIYVWAAYPRLLQHLARDSEQLQQQNGQYAPVSGQFITKFAHEEYPTSILLIT